MILYRTARRAPETHELILETAGRMFARKGFRATTVRQITREAGVNVASVNYYFHDKQELYVRVLQRAHQAAAHTARADRAGTPQKRLQAFIQGFLGYLFDPERPAWQGRLLAREMAEPSPALDRLVTESVLPVKQRLAGIIRDLLGPDATEAQMRKTAFSILGQCLYYVHCQEITKRLFPSDPRETQDVGLLADHIFHFSLGGITALRRQIQSKSSSKHHLPLSKNKRRKTL